jgi:excisionase family DNA binding protein
MTTKSTTPAAPAAPHPVKPTKTEVVANPIWVSPREAMRLTSFGRTRLYELVRSGKLRSITIGRRRLIAFDSIKALGEAA